jgi:hypothetical protein
MLNTHIQNNTAFAQLSQNCNIYRGNVFHFSLQLLVETFFSLINIKQVMLKITAETHAGLHVKYQIP